VTLRVACILIFWVATRRVCCFGMAFVGEMIMLVVDTCSKAESPILRATRVTGIVVVVKGSSSNSSCKRA